MKSILAQNVLLNKADIPPDLMKFFEPARCGTCFVCKLVAVFDEVRRVLRADGTCWVNLGDSYAGSFKGNVPGPNSIVGHRWRGSGDQMKPTPSGGIPAKNLLLIPERFAIAMQDAGWWVRSRIAWCKTSAMPESVRDRPTSAWEHIWLFSKNARYFYDADAVRQPQTGGSHARGHKPTLAPKITTPGNGVRNNGSWAASMTESTPADGQANLRNFWLLGPEPSTLEHYAAYPTELVKRCILAGTSKKGACPACGAPWVRNIEQEPCDKAARIADGENWGPQNLVGAKFTKAGQFNKYSGRRTDRGWTPSCTCDAGEPVPCVVMDIFGGSGTTGLVADRLQRDAILIDLSPTYCDMARQRLQRDAGPMFADSIVVAS